MSFPHSSKHSNTLSFLLSAFLSFSISVLYIFGEEVTLKDISIFTAILDEESCPVAGNQGLNQLVVGGWGVGGWDGNTLFSTFPVLPPVSEGKLWNVPIKIVFYFYVDHELYLMLATLGHNYVRLEFCLN